MDHKNWWKLEYCFKSTALNDSGNKTIDVFFGVRFHLFGTKLLTESSWRKAQVFHPRSHQSIEFLPLGTPEQGQPLLADSLGCTAWTPLGCAGAPPPLPAQPSCPLHTFPPQQWVVWGVGGGGDGLWGGGVPMNACAWQQGLSGFSGVLVVFHCDGYLGLSRKHRL